MFELLGIVFGGASRLLQFWIETRDGQRERDHEYRMFEKQLELAHKRADIDYDMRQMDVNLARDEKEMDLLSTAIKAQAQEAAAAGGWVAQLSASVRPIISYWLLAIYTTAKAAGLYLVVLSGVDLVIAVANAYTEFDGALMGAIVAFWLADRSLRKAGH